MLPAWIASAWTITQSKATGVGTSQQPDAERSTPTWRRRQRRRPSSSRCSTRSCVCTPPTKECSGATSSARIRYDCSLRTHQRHSILILLSPFSLSLVTSRRPRADLALPTGPKYRACLHLRVPTALRTTTCPGRRGHGPSLGHRQDGNDASLSRPSRCARRAYRQD